MNRLRTKLDLIKLTKIDVAEEHIKAAIRLYFSGGHLAPVYTLVAAAREVLTTIGAAFMKHADKDAEGELNFDQNFVEPLLFMVCHDFRLVTGGAPIEAQVFQAWWFATRTQRITDLPLGQQEEIKSRIRVFPRGLRSAPLAEQKRIALHTLNESANDPRFDMIAVETMDGELRLAAGSWDSRIGV